MSEPRSVAELLKMRAQLDAQLEQFQRLVTVMFTDIAGSTRYFDEHGDLAGMAMVQECNDTLQPLVGKHEGKIVKTIGDAVMAYWENPVEAARCAIAMQEGIAKLNQARSPKQQVRIRVALNLGVGLLKDNDVFGDVVNVCSRIEHETAAEKIGVSPSVVEAVSKEKDIVCRKIGTVALRGKAGEMDLYEVVWRAEEKAGAEKPAKVKMSDEQLAMATGTRLGLDEDVRKAIAAAIKGKAPMGVAPTAEKKKFALVEVLPDRSLGKRYPLLAETVVLGREGGDILFPSDALLSREHAAFTTLGGALYVEDLGGANGTFVRLRDTHPLQDDDIILLGRQMFRFRMLTPQAGGQAASPQAQGKPESAQASVLKTGTVLASAASVLATLGPLAELVKLGPGETEEKKLPLPRGDTVLGRTQGTYSFPDDRYLSRAHARFRIHGGHCTLEDLNSTNGTFVRIRERHLLDEDDTVLVGGQFLRVGLQSD